MRHGVQNFGNWNYKKHAKLCVGIYATLFVLDMTIGYVVAKKLLNGPEAK